MKVALQKAVLGTLIVVAAVCAALFGPSLFGGSPATELTTQTTAVGTQPAAPVATPLPTATPTPLPAAILVTTPPTATAVPALTTPTPTPVPAVPSPTPLPVITEVPTPLPAPERAPESEPATDVAEQAVVTPTPSTVATVEPTLVPTVEPTPVPTEVVVVEPTIEPTAEPLPEPSPTPLPTVAPTVEPTPSPTASAEPVETDRSEAIGAAWLYVSSTDGLFLRDVPAGQITDVLTYRSEVHITGEVQTVGERTWAAIDVPGTGWVALSFLVADQPAPPPDPVPTGPSEPPTAADWIAFRQCESGGRYDVVDPSGLYHGAYQFLPSTWDGLVRRFWPELVGVLPSQASPQDQDKVAMKLFELEGARPWPVCGQHLL